MRLVAITLFPVKGARGISVASAPVEPRGLAGDRRWMLVDANGRFVSQREMPALARLQVQPTRTGLLLSFDGAAVEAEIPPADAPRLPVTIWRDNLLLPEARAAREWLTRAFGQPLRLFHHADDARRPVEDWGEPQDEVSLADAFPLLIANPASLAAVQREAGVPLGMERFRPNLVIEGAEAWAEDSWARLRIGAVEIELVKPCDRCKVTTIDQASGTYTGDEPLATLRRIRLSGDRRVPGVLFGWNAAPRSFGEVRVGDDVEVLSTREAWPIRAARRAETTAELGWSERLWVLRIRISERAPPPPESPFGNSRVGGSA